jgi:hypothetical protein
VRQTLCGARDTARGGAEERDGAYRLRRPLSLRVLSRGYAPDKILLLGFTLGSNGKGVEHS